MVLVPVLHDPGEGYLGAVRREHRLDVEATGGDPPRIRAVGTDHPDREAEVRQARVHRSVGDPLTVRRPVRRLLDTRFRDERPALLSVGGDGRNVEAGVIGVVEGDPGAVRRPVGERAWTGDELLLVLAVRVGHPQGRNVNRRVVTAEGDPAVVRSLRRTGGYGS